MKLKFLYDYAGHKAGDVIEVEGEEAEMLLDSGAVAVIDEPKPAKPAKPAK